MALGSSATTDDLFRRVELGFLAGCVGAAVAMAVFLLTRLRASTAREPRACSSRPSSTNRSRSDPAPFMMCLA